MRHVYHLYPIVLDSSVYGMTKEDFVYAMLEERGVKIGTHYIPLHWSTAFQRRGYRRGQFPNAERAMERVVTLPINPRMTREALDYLIQSVKSRFKP